MGDPAIVDTVVLRYFLFVDREQLLLDLLGRPIHVPRIVYDPDEGGVPEAAMSEITRSIFVQRRTAADPARPTAARQSAARKAERLALVEDLRGSGDIMVVDLDQAELETFIRLTGKVGARELGLSFALDPGEAACIAIGVNRDWVVATDDGDAFKALERLAPGHRYERIRRLLRRAGEQELIGKPEANEIHSEMRRLGFRDDTPPFHGE